MSPLEPNKQAEAPVKPAAGDAPSVQQQVIKLKREQAADAQLTTLFGGGYGQYRVRPENFLLSVVTHTAVVAAILWLFHVTIAPKLVEPKNTASIELAPYIPLQVGKNGPSGGGGGDASKLKASAGTPPRAAKQQFTPPVVLQTQKSKLMVEPTVVADLKITPGPQIGDPLSKLMTPSNGTGIGGGIGSGDGGGVGSGHGGPGVGPGIFHIGNGVSAPRAIYTPEPEFSEEARKSKYQGVVVLEIVVGADGRVRDPRVVRSLGMGLDEKAKEAVRNWKFDPAKMNGRPVAVEMAVEVSFNLY
ncbi:MAG TPA: TonB family protein [Candidatus Limnocylindrales bacterium]|nr:TonB family protein [Candidatus Limnocylindrales bacterium]